MPPIVRTAIKTAERLSAPERRAHVLAAAVEEFAEHGFHAASTTAIARRAGISQPYIYALFSNKKELFLEVHRRVAAEIRRRFEEAAAGSTGPEDALQRMGRSYLELLDERAELLCQLQAYAAAGDPDIRADVRDEFVGVMDAVERASGASRDAVVGFVALGMFLTIAGALELPRDRWPTPPVNCEDH